MAEGAMPSRIKVLWFFLCCGGASTGVAAELEILNPRGFSVPDLVDFGFVYSQIRLHVFVEFLLVCHGAFVGLTFCILEYFSSVLMKILRFDDLHV
ncbi:hypothetical protein BRADI_5g01043v3 [Brachypodium distachyon]|uniref:CASP-like protein n=1 Tax=Brachypodium distachyon TaxID=15368 RepID=A0A2K2CER9_BRADI|nr:hypothetical protein BRADI_5g01043v3 [Brachypodium distachyon]